VCGEKKFIKTEGIEIEGRSKWLRESAEGAVMMRSLLDRLS
jgi:hypothetical protein